MIIGPGSPFSPRFLHGFDLDGCECSCIESFYCAMHFPTLEEQTTIAGLLPEDARKIHLQLGATKPRWWNQKAMCMPRQAVEIEAIAGGLPILMERAYAKIAKHSGLYGLLFKIKFEPFEKFEDDSLIPGNEVLRLLNHARKVAFSR